MKNTMRLPAYRARAKNILSLAFAVIAAASGHAAIPAPERILPDDTLLVITAPDFGKVREIFKTSPQTQLWHDPAMKPFRDKFVAKFKEDFATPLERDLGVRFDDYASLPQGQLTFAITQNGWQGEEGQTPGVLLLLDARDKGDQLKKNLADLRKKWLDSGKVIKTEKIRDIEFSILPISEKDIPPTLRKAFKPSFPDETAPAESGTNATKGELVFGQFESLLIIGNSTKVVERLAGQLAGGTMPALGDLAAFDANRLGVFREAPIYAWANAKAFVDVIGRKSTKPGAEPDPFAMFSPEKIMNALGVTGLRSIALGIQNSPEGSMVHLFLGVPESSRQGIFKILAADAKEASPPPFVPADVAKFQRYRIDGQKAWNTLEKIMNDFSPQAIGGINFMLETANSSAQQKDPDFDIRKRLFGNLGDDMINYQKAARGTTPQELNSPPSLFLIGSPKPEQLADALKHLFVIVSRQGTAPTEREFLGRKIYTVQMGGSGRGAPGGRRNLSYAASGGYVAITTDAPMLEEYLRSSEAQQKALRETPGLSEAAAKVGGSATGWFGYENQAETTRSAFEALRKSTANNPGNAALLSGAMGIQNPGEQFKDWFDFSLLPPFESISKYFHFSVHSGSANVDGLSYRIYTPTPPQLKK